jgi:hypothetical protein
MICVEVSLNGNVLCRSGTEHGDEITIKLIDIPVVPPATIPEAPA